MFAGSKGNCTTPGGIGALVGGLSSAMGVAVVAVLTLRAMGECRSCVGRGWGSLHWGKWCRWW